MIRWRLSLLYHSPSNLKQHITRDPHAVHKLKETEHQAQGRATYRINTQKLELRINCFQDRFLAQTVRSKTRGLCMNDELLWRTQLAQNLFTIWLN